MHKSESIQGNEAQKILCDYLLPDRRTDQAIINKKENLLYSGICCPNGPPSENQRKQKGR